MRFAEFTSSKKNPLPLIIFLIIFTIILLDYSSAYNLHNLPPNTYVVNDTVYINDSKVYISATPHTLYSSGWVYFKVKSKVYSGDVDVTLGYDSSDLKPKRAELYSPHTVTWEVERSEYFYNVTNFVQSTDACEIGDEDSKYRFLVDYTVPNFNEIDNSTEWIPTSAVVCFDSYEQIGNDYRVFWNETMSRIEDWRLVTNKFNQAKFYFQNKDNWVYATNLPITAGVEYTLRVWFELPVTKPSHGEYLFAIKPSTETLSEALDNGHLYWLDPWWNSSWKKRKEINLTTSSGTTPSEYQVRLNVTYDSDMQSDFDDLRFVDDDGSTLLPAWLEEKSDGNWAVVWVKVNDTIGTEGTTIYMYYGNSGASNYWSYDTIMYDKFSYSDGTFTGDDWLYPHPSDPSSNVDYTISGGTLYINRHNSVDAGSVETKYSYTYPLNITLKLKVVKDSTGYNYGGFGIYITDPNQGANPSSHYPSLQWTSGGVSTTAWKIRIVYPSGSYVEFGTLTQDYGWHTFKFYILDQNHVSIYVDGTAYTTNYAVSTSYPSEFTVRVPSSKADTGAGWANNDAWYVDDWVVRSYFSSDVTATFGNEEAEIPNVDIIFPTNNTYPHTIALDLNFTYEESSPNTCWYSINGSSNTTIGYTNGTDLSLSEGSYHLQLWCSNTLGGIGSDEVWFSIAKFSWWNDSWARRQAVLLTTPSGTTPSGYQYRLNVSYASGMQSDFDDLRFVDDDGSTLLPAWLEEKSDGNWAVVWVKVNDTIGTEGTTIYMYYGNSGANNYWNGTATFEFFDDFESAPTNEGEGAFQITDNTYLDTNGIGTGTSWHGPRGSYTLQNPLTDFKVQAKIKQTVSVSGLEREMIFLCDGSGNIIYSFLVGDYWNIHGNSRSLLYKGGGTDYSSSQPSGSTLLYDSGIVSTWNDGEWSFKLSRLGSTLDYDYDDTNIWSGDSGVSTSIEMIKYTIQGYGTDPEITTHLINQILVRKYADPEPTASFGSEEENTPQTFTISLNSPVDNAITVDTTPTFSFTATGNVDTYSCELFINDTGYGTTSATNNTATSITANSSIPAGYYNWYINCTNGSTTNQSSIRSITIGSHFTDCGVVIDSGTYYLDADITDSSDSTCIDIQANNVILDCGGHTIDGTDAGSSYGILVDRTSSTASNVTIQNCTVTDWERGVYIRGGNSIISNITVTENNISSSLYGIFLWADDYNGIYGTTITECNISLNNLSNNNYSIFLYSYRLGSGFATRSIVENNTISSNTIDGGERGIILDEAQMYDTVNNNTISNNTISNCSSYAIHLYSGGGGYVNSNTVENNTLLQNNIGIYLQKGVGSLNDNIIKSNIVSSSSTYGIQVSGASSSSIYNNIFNNTDNVYFGGTVSENYWNTTKTIGEERIFTYGNVVAGNYWTNPSGTGYSNNCDDTDHNGFCDKVYDVYNDTWCEPSVNCSSNVDYLPLANTNVIGDCYVIPSSASGKTFYLTQDITDSSDSTCIDIQADDVIFDCNNHTIDGTDIVASNGILVDRSYTPQTTNVTIQNCTMTDWYVGLSLKYSNYNTVMNIISHLNGYGLTLEDSSHNYIANTTLNSNDYFGMFLYDSDYNNITNMTINGNYFVGIGIESSNYNIINNSIIQNSSDYGIYIYSADCSNNTLYNNILNNTDNIYFEEVTNQNYWNTTMATGTNIIGKNYIGGNFWTNPSGTGYSDDCTPNEYGFCNKPYDVYNDRWCEPGVNCSDNVDYLPLTIIPTFTISLNSPVDNAITVDTTPTFSFTATGNVDTYSCELFINDTGYGTTSATNNTATSITANSSIPAGYYNWYINCTSGSTTNQSSIRSITIGSHFTGCGVITDSGTYYLDEDIIDSSTSHCINIQTSNVILDCQRHTIDGNDVADYGIYVYRSSPTTTNITIRNCTVTDWDSANIYFYRSDDNTIINTTSSSSPDYGIYFGYSNNDQITNVTTRGNSYWGINIYHGINNNVTNVLITNNTNGLYLSLGTNNQVTNVTITNNDEYGIKIYQGSDIVNSSRIENNGVYGIEVYIAGQYNPSRIYNNIINNTVNVHFSGTIYENYWNTTMTSGTNIVGKNYIGGNFWTNPSGTGYSDNCTANEYGFCNKPYDVYNDRWCEPSVNCSDNVDYLPLASSFEYTRTVSLPGTIGETITTSFAYTRLLNPVLSISSSLAWISNLTRLLSQPLLVSGSSNNIFNSFRFISETLPLSTTETRLFKVFRLSQQQLPMSVDYISSLSLFKILTTTITYSLNTITHRVFGVTVSQTFSPSDTISEFSQFYSTLQQQVQTTQSLYLEFIYIRTQSLSTTLSETINTFYLTFRTLTLSNTITTTHHSLINRVKTVSQSISPTLSITTIYSYFRTISTTVTTGVTQTFSHIYVRIANLNLISTLSFDITANYNRILTLSSTLTSSISRILVLTRVFSLSISPTPLLYVNYPPQIHNVTLKIVNTTYNDEYYLVINVTDLNGNADRYMARFGTSYVLITGTGDLVTLEIPASGNQSGTLIVTDNNGLNDTWNINFSFVENGFSQIGTTYNLSYQEIEANDTLYNYGDELGYNISYYSYNGTVGTGQSFTGTLPSGSNTSMYTNITGDFLYETIGDWVLDPSQINTDDLQYIIKSLNITTYVNTIWQNISTGNTTTLSLFGTCDLCTDHNITFTGNYSNSSEWHDTGDVIYRAFVHDVTDVVLGEREEYWWEYKYYNQTGEIELYNITVIETTNDTYYDYGGFIRVYYDNTWNDIISTEESDCNTNSSTLYPTTLGNFTFYACMTDTDGDSKDDYFKVVIPNFTATYGEWNIRYGGYIGTPPANVTEAIRGGYCTDDQEGDEVGDLICYHNQWIGEDETERPVLDLTNQFYELIRNIIITFSALFILAFAFSENKHIFESINEEIRKVLKR